MSASSESTSNPSSSSVPPLQQPPARAEAKAVAQTSEISRQQPIPPPSELLQYRAIGLVRGRYQPSEEQFNRGNLLTEDGTELDAVLLGQVMSLVKKHLDLEKQHLWVVYPRTREKLQTLHLQIVGVWEPEQLNPTGTEEAAPSLTTDGFFSVRGEIIFQSQEKGFAVVKIQQSARKGSEPPKFFKVRVEGTVTLKPGYFWDVEANRQGNNLVLVKANTVALLPPKKPAKVNRDRPKPSRDRAGSTYSPRAGKRPASGGTATPQEPRQSYSKPTKPIKRNPDPS
ncbi:MAG: hypothetical protein KME35_09790 [Aphanocapsa sp. GSE-SYN-MK-11-07L]|jgi:hypothetical protein|nr:hypothetical protein [Aphanocapsa sp. GSE-SYN-MK-11-07L]